VFLFVLVMIAGCSAVIIERVFGISAPVPRKAPKLPAIRVHFA
jgi:hypothetical protein